MLEITGDLVYAETSAYEPQLRRRSVRRQLGAHFNIIIIFLIIALYY